MLLWQSTFNKNRASLVDFYMPARQFGKRLVFGPPCMFIGFVVGITHAISVEVSRLRQ